MLKFPYRTNRYVCKPSFILYYYYYVEMLKTFQTFVAFLKNIIQTIQYKFVILLLLLLLLLLHYVFICTSMYVPFIYNTYNRNNILIYIRTSMNYLNIKHCTKFKRKNYFDENFSHICNETS